MVVWQSTVESLVIDLEFWKGKKVLITGHTGFKGGWLSLWLQSLGARVIGYSLPAPTQPSLFEIARVGDGMTSIMGDVRDLDHLQSVISEHRPQIIIHMAAQSLVRKSYVEPVETYAVNVMGTVNLLEATRRAGGAKVKAVVIVTSDKCYENREWLWGYRENERMGGYDPYSNSKGCAELVTSAYRSSYFNPAAYDQHGVAVASVRVGNVIGGGDWAENRLIPDIMRAVQSGEPIKIRNPHAIRPWQHVLEPSRGYLQLMQKLIEEGPGYAESWNFGPSDEDARPVQWIVEQLTKEWGEGVSWMLSAEPQLHEANYLKLDCSKAAARLNWKPRWELERALDAILEWYRAYLKQADMRSVTLRQIEMYWR